MRSRQITLFFQLSKEMKTDIEHIRFGPYLSTVGSRIFAIVATVRCELQWNQILIVVVSVVTTKADEHSQLIVLQIRGIRHEVIGMNEHLHAFIVTQVQTGVPIDCLRLALSQFLDHDIECLFVVLHKLRL